MAKVTTRKGGAFMHPSRLNCDSIVIVKRSREELEIAEILAITSGFRVSVAQQQAKEVADEVSGGRDGMH